jgi:thiamine-phosphate pyrophosphorylase
MRNSLRNNFDLSVYLVADPSVCKGRALPDIVKDAAAGVTMVQLRDKSGDFKDAIAVRDILKPLKIPFLINDNVDLAKKIDADGVHLGQGDMNPAEARKILGENKIIGLTAFKPIHFEMMDANIVDYAGTGPFFATLTKPDKMVLGSEGFQSLVNISSVPVVGIGGITPENAAEVIQAGASGVAMMRAISESDDPKQVAQEFVQAIKKIRKAS